MAETTRISCCTAVRNRSDLLRLALPSWLALQFLEVIVVDWSSAESVYGALTECRDRSVRVYRVHDEVEFVPSRAWNFAISLASAEFVLKVDADVILHPCVREVELEPTSFYSGSVEQGKGTTGTALVHRRMFELVNGYNERLRSWGYEDNDLYDRLVQAGLTRRAFAPGSLTHLSHSSDLRLPKNRLQNIASCRLEPWTPLDARALPPRHHLVPPDPPGSPGSGGPTHSGSLK